MTKVEIQEGTSVFTSDGKEVGKINRFVLDPGSNEVTHIVVQKGWLLPEDKVVPFDMVRSVTEDKVALKEDIEDFNQLPSFEEQYFVQASEEDIGDSPLPRYYWYPPQGYVGYPAYGLRYPAWPPVATKQNIPENTVPLREGTDVISSTGEHVGDIERLLMEPDSNQVTHFVISRGLLFKDRKLVPTAWVKSMEDDKVHLTVSARLLEKLPSYES